MTKISNAASVSVGLARSGHGAGARTGDWKLRMVDSADIADDGWLELDSPRTISVVQNPYTESHLLRPFDVLVTVRTRKARIALVPPGVSRTVAGVTQLVVRARCPEIGMGHWLWFWLTSSWGRAQLHRHGLRGRMLPLMTARDLGRIRVPVPSPDRLGWVARFVESSESAYRSEIEAARIRRQSLRDALVQDLSDLQEPPCR